MAGGLPELEPKLTPTRPDESTGSPSSPASSSAFPAARALSSETRPMARRFFRGQCSGSWKSGTGDPRRVLKSTTSSQRSTRRMPLRPPNKQSLTVFQSWPIGEIPAIPVTTTRRLIPARSAEARVDEVDHIPDGADRFQILLLEGEPGLLLETHREVDRVDAVEIEIVDEVGREREVSLRDLELPLKDFGYPLIDGFPGGPHRHPSRLCNFFS